MSELQRKSPCESASPETEDEDRFIGLLQLHRNQILGYLFCVVHNLDDAEDLFQQVSITLWDKFSTFDPSTNFESWAVTVARNKAMTFLRSKRREAARFSDQLVEAISLRDLWTPTEADQRLTALETCQKKLASDDQMLLAMCYRSEGSTAEVARSLGRPVDSVYTSLSRIRRALFNCIQRTLAREEHA